jgi:hypothetical protein
MIAVAMAAILLTLFRALGEMVAFVLIALLLPVGWFKINGDRHVSAWGFGTAAAVGNLTVIFINIYMLNLFGIICAGLAWLLTMPAIFGFGAYWTRDRNPWREFAKWAAVLLLMLCPLGTMITDWPLRLAFLISRPAMENLADRVAAGTAPPGPVWAGVYRIAATALDTRTGNIGLLTDPGGGSGFVRLKPANPPQFFGPLINVGICVDLGANWMYQVTD